VINVGHDSVKTESQQQNAKGYEDGVAGDKNEVDQAESTDHNQVYANHISDLSHIVGEKRDVNH